MASLPKGQGTNTLHNEGRVKITNAVVTSDLPPAYQVRAL